MSEGFTETEMERWARKQFSMLSNGDYVGGGGLLNSAYQGAERLRLEGVYKGNSLLTDPRWGDGTPITLTRLQALLAALPVGEWRFVEVRVNDDLRHFVEGAAPHLGLHMRHVETGVAAVVWSMGEILDLCDQVAAARFAAVMGETIAAGYDQRMRRVRADVDARRPGREAIQAAMDAERAEKAENQPEEAGGVGGHGSERAGPDDHVSEPQRHSAGQPGWWLPGDPVP